MAAPESEIRSPGDVVRDEGEDAHRRTAPTGRVVYRAILYEADGELARSSRALFWSGLAAGLSMGFSLVAEALLRAALPAAPWRTLVTKLGYGLGFLVVILGRQQLFTENTLTPILSLLNRRGAGKLRNVLRLWSVVLVANLFGGLAIAWVFTSTPAVDAATHAEILKIGRETIAPGFLEIVVRGVIAGWLIALMIWLLPFAESARVWVILIIAWLVGVGHFSHVIAGSIQVFALSAGGELSLGRALLDFTLPALLGNVVGGVLLVAALAHAQVAADHD